MAEKNPLIEERYKKLREIEKSGKHPFSHRFEKTHMAYDINEKYAHLDDEQHTTDEVVVAGRLMNMRKMGKLIFAPLMDETGRVQVVFLKDTLKEEFDFLKLLDIGDLIGIKGVVFKTKKGQVSIEVKEYELLAKSLRPLPEKWHGLKDDELKYRMRYVDLIVNEDSRKRFVIRSRIIEGLRQSLIKQGFLEVETPILQPIYGGAEARPFITHHNSLDREMYLRISNELYLKRLIVGGFEKVFEFSKDFRNEGIDTKHNPEFTLIETMAAYWDYMDSMKCIEELISSLAQKILGKTKLTFQGTEIDLTPPWKKATMVDLVKEHTGKDFTHVKEVEEARKFAQELGVKIEDTMGVGAILADIFDAKVEDKIVQPTFVMDHPVEISPLARKKKDNFDFTERFELLIGGREYANVYSELNDPEHLRENWESQKKKREAGAEETHPMDEDFIRALEYGMPPTSGIGIGVDRLVMLFTDAGSIRDVILFPILKKKEGED